MLEITRGVLLVSGTYGKKNLAYRISFATIRLFHDNFLLRFFIDPVTLLQDLGLDRGDKVLEVGCGPGFYTIGAAIATGPRGMVYSYDVNPYATDYVRQRIKEAGFDNVKVENKTAADTGLPGESIDFVFVAGVPHIVGGTSCLFDEIARVVKPGGLLAYASSRGKTSQLISFLKQREFHLEYKRMQFSICRKVC